MAFQPVTTCTYFDLREGDCFTQDLSPYAPKFEVLRLCIREGRVFATVRRYDCGYKAKPQELTTSVRDLRVVYLGPRNPV